MGCIGVCRGIQGSGTSDLRSTMLQDWDFGKPSFVAYTSYGHVGCQG